MKYLTGEYAIPSRLTLLIRSIYVKTSPLVPFWCDVESLKKIVCTGLTNANLLVSFRRVTHIQRVGILWYIHLYYRWQVTNVEEMKKETSQALCLLEEKARVLA